MKKLSSFLVLVYVLIAVSSLAQSNYVTPAEEKAAYSKCMRKLADSYVGKTFTAKPEGAIPQHFYERLNSRGDVEIFGPKFKVRNPEKFTLVSYKWCENCFVPTILYWKVSFSSGKEAYMPHRADFVAYHGSHAWNEKEWKCSE